jgi:hypothetical protein
MTDEVILGAVALVCFASMLLAILIAAHALGLLHEPLTPPPWVSGGGRKARMWRKIERGTRGERRNGR